MPKSSAKKILVCISGDLLKRMDSFKTKYKNRSEMIRKALELLIASHKRKVLERQFKEGFRILKNLNRDFAKKSTALSREIYKN